MFSILFPLVPVFVFYSVSGNGVRNFNKSCKHIKDTGIYPTIIQFVFEMPIQFRWHFNSEMVVQTGFFPTSSHANALNNGIRFSLLNQILNPIKCFRSFFFFLSVASFYGTLQNMHRMVIVSPFQLSEYFLQHTTQL